MPTLTPKNIAMIRMLALLALLLAPGVYAGCGEEPPFASTDVGVDLGPDSGGPDSAMPDIAAPDIALEAGSDATEDSLAPDGVGSAQKPIWLLHLTDVHIGASMFASTALTKVIQDVIPTIKPTATIITGDVTQTGTASQWTSYEKIVKGNVPAFPAYLEVPGNHDMRTDMGKYFLSHSQTGKAKGGLYGYSDVKAVGSTIRVVRTNTADHKDKTMQGGGYFSSSQHYDLLSKMPSTKPNHTVVAGHHPVEGVVSLQLLGTDWRMKDLFNKVNAEVYFCGHMHTKWTSWVKNTLVVMTPTLGKPETVTPTPTYALVGLDTTGPSLRTVGIGSQTLITLPWPLVLVTTPAQIDLGFKNPLAKPVYPGKAMVVRALAFSPKGVTKVEVKLEGGSWAAMTSAGNSLWQATVTAPAKTGNRILEVKATSPEGSDTHKIKFLVGT